MVVPSLWPENSPLVIHEAFMAGVPVVGARQGGIPGLVSHGVSGLLYDAFSPSDLAASLRMLIDDPGRVERLAAGAPPVKTVVDDAREWEARYERVLRSLRTSAALCTASPLILVITSPALRPAVFPGIPSSTVVTSAPSFVPKYSAS